METLESVRTTEEIDVLVEEIYEPAFYRVAAFVARNGGSVDDARDVFHDALVVLHAELRKGRDINSLIAYVCGVSKNLWRDRLRSEPLREIPDIADNSVNPSVNERRLLAFVASTGARCLDLLAAFFYDRVSIGAIAQKFGFAGEHSASVQKYKCIEKMRETIRTKKLEYEDFLE